MRYFSEITKVQWELYSETYLCDHPVYDKCTLYKKDGRGLAVIQQRHLGKLTWWTEVDPGVANAVYEHPKFVLIFESMAAEPKDGLYPTITIRQLMWALRMKPIRKERWETVFDRKDI